MFTGFYRIIVRSNYVKPYCWSLLQACIWSYFYFFLLDLTHSWCFLSMPMELNQSHDLSTCLASPPSWVRGIGRAMMWTHIMATYQFISWVKTCEDQGTWVVLGFDTSGHIWTLEWFRNIVKETCKIKSAIWWVSSILHHFSPSNLELHCFPEFDKHDKWNELNREISAEKHPSLRVNVLQPKDCWHRRNTSPLGRIPASRLRKRAPLEHGFVAKWATSFYIILYPMRQKK